VENPVITVQTFDGPAQSAIQYFENMRNFLVAVSAMNLLMFETSDIEKVNSWVALIPSLLYIRVMKVFYYYGQFDLLHCRAY
jgi:kinesin family protein C2/C3